MKHLFKKILTIGAIFFASAGLVAAATVLTVPQGGTGLASVTPMQVLYGGTAASGPLGISADFTFNNVTKYLDVNGIIDASVQYNIGGLFFGDQDQGNLSVSVGNNAHNVALGSRNTVFGNDAANNLTIGNDNTVIGQNAAGDASWASNQNTAVGSGAARLLSGGARNTIMGYRSGDGITAGNDNVFLGTQAGFLTAGASDNVAIGSFALDSNVSGSSNIAIGSGALTAATANSLVGIGGAAGLANVSGAQNTYIGFATNSVLGTDNDVLAVGYTATAANRGTAIGSNTIAADSGIALGHTANAASGEFALPNTLSNFKFQGDSYVLPVAGSIATAGALTNDGAGNLTWIPAGGGTVTGTGTLGQATFWTGASTISGSGDFLWNDITKEFSVGDIGSTGNDVTFNVFDPTNRIVGRAGEFTIENAGGQQYLNVNPALESVQFGDISGAGNQTNLQLSDISEDFTLQADRGFVLSTVAGDGWMRVNPFNGLSEFGDISSVSNDTLLTVDDGNQTLNAHVIPAPAQANEMNISTAGIAIAHTNAGGSWGFQGSAAGGGQAHILGGLLDWTWPAADSVGTQALISNGSGALGWATIPTGNITGSGTAPRIPYWNSATALIDDASFTRLANHGVLVEDNATNHNVFLGNNVGVAALSGSVSNVAIGNGNFTSVTTGDANVAIGTATGTTLTTGSNNIMLGNSINTSAISGSTGIGIGFSSRFAGSSITLGNSSGAATATGTDSILIGNSNGTSLTSGTRNILIGSFAGSTITTGSDNLAFGNSAGVIPGTLSETISFNGVARATRQIVFGNDTGVIYNDMFLGQGVQASGSLGTFTIHGSGKNGFSNETGQNLAIAAGRSSGTALPANAFLQTSNSIASGTTEQTLVTVAQTLGLEDYMGFKVNHGFIADVTVLNDADYNASTTANLQAATPTYIFPTLTAPRNFTLPDITDVAWGTEITIKDGKGSAGADNITLTASGTDVIDGTATYVMTINYQSITLVAWGDIGGNYWSIK